MKREERALQIWPILVGAARNRQTLTYEMVSELVGMGRGGGGARLVSPWLAKLMDYCKRKGLPAITVLVVNKGTGRPGDGLTGVEDPDKEREDVFNHPWFQGPPLTVKDLLEDKDM
jgi:hypothetical protein